MPSLRSIVPSPIEKLRAEPYRLIQAGPKVGKNPGKRANIHERAPQADYDFLISLFPPSTPATYFSFPLKVLPSLLPSLLTSVTILLIGDLSRVQIMGSDRHITHASLIADLWWEEMWYFYLFYRRVHLNYGEFSFIMTFKPGFSVSDREVETSLWRQFAHSTPGLLSISEWRYDPENMKGR